MRVYTHHLGGGVTCSMQIQLSYILYICQEPSVYGGQLTLTDGFRPLLG